MVASEITQILLPLHVGALPPRWSEFQEKIVPTLFALFGDFSFVAFQVYTFYLGLHLGASFLFLDQVIGGDLGASPDEPATTPLSISLSMSSSSSPYVNFAPCSRS